LVSPVPAQRRLSVPGPHHQLAETLRIVPEVDLMPCMFTGGTYILHEAFDAGRVIETIHTERGTHMIMGPSQIVAVLNHPAFAPEKLGSLEMLQNIDAPLHVEFKQRINALLPVPRSKTSSG
jgi:hypothetical protein